jgi:isoaspartyl peptidase/L-asparaginase-like protein (Ntn-hydrolase superfamily)
VAALQRVKNPILVARKVMEETDHVMLAGEGAQRFARVDGLRRPRPVTAARRADWEDKKRPHRRVLGPKSLNVRRFLQDHPAIPAAPWARRRRRVGCARRGDLDGGVTLKLVGRVGDTPIPGAGNYASEHVAASATGTGEYVMRSCPRARLRARRARRSLGRGRARRARADGPRLRRRRRAHRRGPRGPRRGAAPHARHAPRRSSGDAPSSRARGLERRTRSRSPRWS